MLLRNKPVKLLIFLFTLGFGALNINIYAAAADTTKAVAKSAQQDSSDPNKMLKGTLYLLQEDIGQDHASLKASPEKLYQLVKDVLLPVLDVEEMAGATLGQKWKEASDTQKEQFIDFFGLMLTKRYADALLTVSDYELKFRALPKSVWENSDHISIAGQVSSKNGGAPSRVTYYLVKKGKNWQVYDMAIEGVSLVENYRSQFQSFSNIAALIDRLKKMNKDT